MLDAGWGESGSMRVKGQGMDREKKRGIRYSIRNGDSRTINEQGKKDPIQSDMPATRSRGATREVRYGGNKRS